MKTPFILFVTGISAAGKTTLYEMLRSDKSLTKADLRDIDENGVPPVGRSPWRAYRVEQLLHEAKANHKKQQSSIIFGVTKPHEVIESKHYSDELNIHFLYLKIPFKVFKERIDKRIEDIEKKGVFDEIFNKDNLEEIFVETKKLARILENSTLNQKHGHVLDVSKLDKETMKKEVKKLTTQISG